jgi:hypothetical protein
VPSITAPFASIATARSSSVIALATHVTSWRETSGRSAVTSPPCPRCSTRSPFRLRL